MAAVKKESPRPFAAAARVIRWQRAHGRRNLPWQGQNAYRVWVSEIMLQQTQVAAVIPYYEKFLRRFPTAAALARAPVDDVLAAWSGLGYYARARHMHRAAQAVGENPFPHKFDALIKLPGVGRYTAAAVAVFAGGERQAVVDGNIRRVLARFFAINEIGARGEQAAWAAAETLLPPHGDIRAYTQGMMDIGAGVCKSRNPLCAQCPLAAGCAAKKMNKTSAFPPRAAAEKKPTRRAVMMLVVNPRGDALLEQRPPRGLWGGLWSLPMCFVDDAGGQKQLRSQLPSRAALRLQKTRAAPPQILRHEFTHFRLEAEVLFFQCKESAAAAPFAFFAKRRIKTAALPAPVKKFLMAASSLNAKGEK